MDTLSPPPPENSIPLLGGGWVFFVKPHFEGKKGKEHG